MTVRALHWHSGVLSPAITSWVVFSSQITMSSKSHPGGQADVSEHNDCEIQARVQPHIVCQCQHAIWLQMKARKTPFQCQSTFRALLVTLQEIWIRARMHPISICYPIDRTSSYQDFYIRYCFTCLTWEVDSRQSRLCLLYLLQLHELAFDDKVFAQIHHWAPKSYADWLCVRFAGMMYAGPICCFWIAHSICMPLLYRLQQLYVLRTRMHAGWSLCYLGKFGELGSHLLEEPSKLGACVWMSRWCHDRLQRCSILWSSFSRKVNLIILMWLTTGVRSWLLSQVYSIA